MNNQLAANYFNLAGDVALITGASSGLGHHFAMVLAAAGMTVGIAARREDRLKELAQAIERKGGNAVPLVMDVTNRESLQQGIKLLVQEAGPISVLVNNAGMAVAHSFLDATEDDARAVFELNQMAVWQVAQSVAQHMQQEGISGRIINIASIAGLRTMGGAASYAVSKAAVVQLTKVMAMELARYTIRVNALAPGYIATEINKEFLDSEQGMRLIKRSPLRRRGELRELDSPLLLLASPNNSFMTGAVIPVDGGHLVSSL